MLRVVLLLCLLSWGCRDKDDPPDPAGPRGLVPLDLANEWAYQVRTDAGTDTLRRVVEARIGGVDAYSYLLVDSVFGESAGTRYYLSNHSNLGTLLAVSDSAAADTLFRYPDIATGDYYFCGADCVLVLIAPPGVSRTIFGNTFFGVVAYQRFFAGQTGHSAQYWLDPQDTGIIREVEFSANDTLALRDVFEWVIHN